MSDRDFKVGTKTRTVEQRRALLRHMLKQKPMDATVQQALSDTLSPELIHKAAIRGVFISYDRNDELFALELELQLREANIDVWLDAISIADGADWQQEVVNALKRCGVLLAVLSPAYVENPEAQRERTYFIESGKVVIPLLHQTCDMESANMLYTPLDFRDNYKLAMSQLKRLLQPTGASV